MRRRQRPLTASTHIYRHKLDFGVERVLLERYVKPSSPVLDVGTGATARSALLAQSTGGEVCSIEINQRAVAEFAGKNPGHGLGLAAADLLNLPFSRASFSVVLVALHGLDYILKPEDRWRSYQEIERVLIPGGTLIFNGFNPLGMVLSPTGLRVRGGLKARAAYVSSATFLKRTLIDVNGLELHQALPRRTVAAVQGTTELRFEAVFNLSGSTSRRWLISLLSTAPYYTFKKPERELRAE